MTTIEEHKKIIQELVDDLNEKIRSQLIAKRQKIVGFAISEAATNLFALYLHKKNLIEPSYSVNHNFFASLKRAHSTFPIDFPNKDTMLKTLVDIEDYRIKLCYGRDKDAEIVNEAVKKFFSFKLEIENQLGEENEHQ